MSKARSSSFPPPTPSQVKAVYAALRATFGGDFPLPGRPPLDELVLTLLSQHTNDKNRDRAFSRLRARYPDWEAASQASRADLEAAIKVAGLAKMRSERLQALLATIQQQEGELTLEHLAEKPLQQALDYLTALPGIGRKTAACVLLFSFGKPVMPVDVHIQRVVKRLGWAPEKATADAISKVLTEAVPHQWLLDLHLNLISLGRTFCRPANPKCTECPVRAFCPWPENSAT